MIFVYILLALYLISVLAILVYTPIRRGMREEKGIQNSWQDEQEFGELTTAVLLWPVILAFVICLGPFYGIYWCLVQLGKFIARKSSK